MKTMYCAPTCFEVLEVIDRWTYYVRGGEVYREYTNCMDVRDVWGFPCGGRWECKREHWEKMRASWGY